MMYNMKTSAGYRMIQPATSPTTRTLWLPVVDQKQLYPNIQLLMRFNSYPEPHHVAEYWDCCPDRRYIIFTEHAIRATVENYFQNLMIDEVFLSKLKSTALCMRDYYERVNSAAI